MGDFRVRGLRTANKLGGRTDSNSLWLVVVRFAGLAQKEQSA
jgi:hypothetical protein